MFMSEMMRSNASLAIRSRASAAERAAPIVYPSGLRTASRVYRTDSSSSTTRMAGWRAYRSVLDATLAVSITKLVTLKAGFLRNYNRNALPGTRKLDDTAYAQVAVTL